MSRELREENIWEKCIWREFEVDDSIGFERVGKYGSTEELLVYLGESRIGIGSFERIMRGIHGTREEWISLLHFYQVSRVTDQLNWH